MELCGKRDTTPTNFPNIHRHTQINKWNNNLHIIYNPRRYTGSSPFVFLPLRVLEAVKRLRSHPYTKWHCPACRRFTWTREHPWCVLWDCRHTNCWTPNGQGFQTLLHKGTCKISAGFKRMKGISCILSRQFPSRFSLPILLNTRAKTTWQIHSEAFKEQFLSTWAESPSQKSF